MSKKINLAVMQSFKTAYEACIGKDGKFSEETWKALSEAFFQAVNKHSELSDQLSLQMNTLMNVVLEIDPKLSQNKQRLIIEKIKSLNRTIKDLKEQIKNIPTTIEL